MSALKLHFLDARGALTGLRNWLETSLSETYDKANTLMPLGPIDVIVKAGAYVIPEKGHLGYTPEAGAIFVTLDPRNPALGANVNLSLERMFAHELHHAARWDGLGYGATLGEALVSEGLAGQFVWEVFGDPPEPWESLSMGEIRPHVARAVREWSRSDYGHSAWFFGAADLPRWLGYSLGFQLVACFLSEHADQRASTLVGADAQQFRDSMQAI